MRRQFAALAIFLALFAAAIGLCRDAGPARRATLPVRHARPPGQQGQSRATAPIPDVLYIPTPHDVAAKMIELAAVRRDDVVYDLGCGDGRIVIEAAARHGCRSVGVDIDPDRVAEARNRAAEKQVQNLVRFEERDLFQADLREATVVMLYLSPQYNLRLVPQLNAMKPGSRIVSHQFEIRGVKPDRIVSFMSQEDGRRHTLYVWTTPLAMRN